MIKTVTPHLEGLHKSLQTLLSHMSKPVSHISNHAGLTRVETVGPNLRTKHFYRRERMPEIGPVGHGSQLDLLIQTDAV